jgi:hypothetical protein
MGWHISYQLFVCKSKGGGIAKRYREKGRIIESKLRHNGTDDMEPIFACVDVGGPNNGFDSVGYHIVACLVEHATVHYDAGINTSSAANACEEIVACVTLTDVHVPLTDRETSAYNLC